MSTDLRQPHAFITVALKALKKRADRSGCVEQRVILADLPEGIINADQLHEALPHPMHLIKVTLKGSDMRRLIREMEKVVNFCGNFRFAGWASAGKFWRIML